MNCAMVDAETGTSVNCTVQDKTFGRESGSKFELCAKPWYLCGIPECLILKHCCKLPYVPLALCYCSQMVNDHVERLGWIEVVCVICSC